MNNDNRPMVEGAWRSTGVLLVAWFLAFIDRSILIVLIPGIKESLAISDTEVSLLSGFAFGLFFAFAGLAVGRLVDRSNRRNLLLISLVGWSLATMLCGLAYDYTTLFIGRSLAGVCEAVLAPASFSLLSDLFPSERRGKPAAILLAAGSFGTNFAIFLGGILVAFFAARPPMDLPFYGSLAPWQSTLIMAGMPGLLLAAFFAKLKEPERQIVADEVPKTNFNVIPHIRTNMRFFVPMLAAFACHFLLAYGITTWFPVLIMRGVGYGPAETGVSLGVVKLLAALGVGFIGGIVSDAFAKGDPAGGRLRLVRILLILQVAAICPFIFSNSIVAVLTGVFFYTAFVTLGSSVIYASLPDYVPARGRGQIVSIEQFISALLGMSVGPTLVAVVTDHVFGDENKLHLSLLVVGSIIASLGVLLITLALPAGRRLHARLGNTSSASHS